MKGVIPGILFLLIASKVCALKVDFKATEVCYGEQTVLVAITDIPDTAVANYFWDLDNDSLYDDAIGKSVSFLFATADTFPVRLKIVDKTNQADSMITPKNVVVNPVPNVNFHADNLCAGKAAVYMDQSTINNGAIIEYRWDFNNDGVIDDNSGPVVSYNNGAAATYVTMLEVETDKGCTAFATKTTQVFEQPEAKFTIANTCEGDTTVFANKSTISGGNISLYIWNYGDGKQDLNPVKEQHVYASDGSFNIRLIAVTDNFCRDTMEKSVTITPKPDINLTLSGDTHLYHNETLDLTVTTGASNVLWSTGETTSTISVVNAGTYTVTATDSKGCTAGSSVTVTKEKKNESVVTDDILTPNGDGVNDKFEIKDLDAYENCSIVIYNVWGDEVFSSDNYQNEWEGTYNGGPLDAGTYFYVIRCTGEDQRIGNINILR